MLQIQATKQTMSSREIAKLTGKEHAKVIIDIKRVLDEAEIDDAGFRAIYLDSMNRERGFYNLPRRECDLVIAGYSTKYRLAIIDRWQELEAAKTVNLADASSLRNLLLGYTEQVITLENKIKSDAPKVEFHAAVSGAINAQSIEEVAKVLGTGRNRMFNWLRSVGLLMANNLPYQDYIDRQYFRVIENAYKDNKGEAHTYTRTLITGKGLAYIQSRYMAEAA